MLCYIISALKAERKETKNTTKKRTEENTPSLATAYDTAVPQSTWTHLLLRNFGIMVGFDFSSRPFLPSPRRPYSLRPNEYTTPAQSQLECIQRKTDSSENKTSQKHYGYHNLILAS